MSKIHLSAFKLPSIRTKNIRVVYSVAAETITLSTELMCHYLIKAGNMWSLESLQTQIRPSKYCRQNQESSEMTTFCHSRILHYRLAPQSRLLSPYVSFSREAKVIIAKLIGNTVENVFVLYERKIGLL